jgi:hypothetical protein
VWIPHPAQESSASKPVSSSGWCCRCHEAGGDAGAAVQAYRRAADAGDPAAAASAFRLLARGSPAAAAFAAELLPALERGLAPGFGGGWLAALHLQLALMHQQQGSGLPASQPTQAAAPCAVHLGLMLQLLYTCGVVASVKYSPGRPMFTRCPARHTTFPIGPPALPQETARQRSSTCSGRSSTAAMWMATVARRRWAARSRRRCRGWWLLNCKLRR